MLSRRRFLVGASAVAVTAAAAPILPPVAPLFTGEMGTFEGIRFLEDALSHNARKYFDATAFVHDKLVEHYKEWELKRWKDALGVDNGPAVGELLT